MASTPIYNLPAPDYPQASDGPSQIHMANMAIEALLNVGTLKMTGGAIELSPPTAGSHPVTLSYWQGHIVIGPAASAPAAGALPDGALYLGT